MLILIIKKHLNYCPNHKNLLQYKSMNKSRVKKYLSLAILAAYILLICLILVKPASAYTGSIAIFPALTGGPDHRTNSNFEINTENNNPAWQTTSLNYVESVVIQTNPGIKSHLIISEYPQGDNIAFSFTVPQPFQDALVNATVYFWGPDVDTLQITHQHQGLPDDLLNATKVKPIQRNANNDVLWYFTTSSFSDFYLTKINKGVNTNIPTFALLSLSAMCLSAYLVLRKN